MRLSGRQIADFRKTLWAYYDKFGRGDLPWRLSEPNGEYDPYKILFSEMMLQQTQVQRVIPKYLDFLHRFPTLRSLAEADLSEVLRVWQGLGYNRRAKYLWLAAQQLVGYGGFPTQAEELARLPGIGKNTAGAILAYTFDMPIVFIETNIRTVYIYHFAQDGEIVSDDFIRDLLVQTLEHEKPREFYWALMDYGTSIKSHVRNTSQSKHLRKQSTFEGSRRQIRGGVIRLLGGALAGLTGAELTARISDARLQSVLDELVAEKLIRKNDSRYEL